MKRGSAWSYVIRVKDPETGVSRPRWVGGFATEDDVKGLVSTMSSGNECDPLRDEGVNFYRLLLRAGVKARCRQIMGTIHGTEPFAIACPEISRETAASIAQFCRTV